MVDLSSGTMMGICFGGTQFRFAEISRMASLTQIFQVEFICRRDSRGIAMWKKRRKPWKSPSSRKNPDACLLFAEGDRCQAHFQGWTPISKLTGVMFMLDWSS